MNIPENSRRIAELVYPECEVVLGYGVTGQTSVDIIRAKNGSYIPVPNYYYNWNDLMPLVFEHGVNIGFLSTMHENPQHALADCLLKVLEERSK